MSEAKPRVNGGRVVLQRWRDDEGVSETQHAFETIHELFAHCLDVAGDETADRIELEGVDRHGQTQRLTLSFQSMSVSRPGD